MAQTNTKSKQTQAALILTIALLAGGAFVFVIALVISGAANADASSINQQSYAAETAAALEGAMPSAGAALIKDHACVACHALGNGAVAPLFDGIADRAAQQRPPLSAEQYLYESIAHPAAYILEPYANAMPNDYDLRLSQQEIGHIIAYLMTLATET